MRIVWNQRVLAAIMLVAVTVWVYAPIRNHQFLRFDDYAYVADNARIQQGLTWTNAVWAMTAYENALWKPVTLISHMLDSQLFGLNPAGHLLTNLGLHVLSVIVLFCVLLQTTGSLWPSTLVAGLFALHPLNVESVAWVAERKNVLSTLFWVLAMWAYIRYVKRPGWLRYLGVMAALVLGLMSKPMLVTLPCALLLMDYWPLGRLPARWKGFRERLPGLVVEKLPLFVAVAIVSAVTILAAQSRGDLADAGSLPLGVRIGNTLLAYGLYLKKMVWPTDLAIFYPYPAASLSFGSVAVATLLLAGISVWVWARRRKSPYLAVGWLWYLGTMFPVNGLLQSGGQAMADRYSYIPLVGVFVMIAWGAAELVENRSGMKRWALGAGIGVLMVLAVVTRYHVGFWQDTTTLFEHALQVTSNNYVAHNVLGLESRAKGESGKALEHFQEALRINPRYIRSHNNLGVVLLEQQRFEEAMGHFSQTLEIDPRSYEAHHNSGLALVQTGDLAKGIEHFYTTVEIRPEFAQGYSDLATALQQTGRLDEALEHAEEALRIDPNLVEAHNVLGITLFQIGRESESVQHFRKAVEIEPGFVAAHANMGSVLASRGQTEEAVDAFRQVLRLDPNNQAAQQRLGELLERMPSPN